MGRLVYRPLPIPGAAHAKLPSYLPTGLCRFLQELCSYPWIEIATRGRILEVRARDDGRGADQVHEGQGLTGMRERLQECGGRLEVHTEPRRGFHLTAVMPLPGAQ